MLFFPVSLIPDLIKDSWILKSASASSVSFEILYFKSWESESKNYILVFLRKYFWALTLKGCQLSGMEVGFGPRLCLRNHWATLGVSWG